MASTEAPAERLSNRSLTPLKRDHALLGPGQLSQMAEEVAHELMAEGESNTRATRTRRRCATGLQGTNGTLVL